MNVPQTELARQRAEAEAFAELVTLLKDGQDAAKEGVVERTKELLEVIYPVVAANALASGDGTATLTIDFTLRFAAGGPEVSAVARSAGKAREFRA